MHIRVLGYQQHKLGWLANHNSGESRQFRFEKDFSFQLKVNGWWFRC